MIQFFPMKHSRYRLRNSGKDFFLFIINHIGSNSLFSFATRYYDIFLRCQKLWKPSFSHDGMGAEDKPNWVRMAERRCKKCQSHLMSGFLLFEFVCVLACLMVKLVDLKCHLQPKASPLLPIIFLLIKVLPETASAYMLKARPIIPIT